jgi:hypothetical protein
MYFIDVYFEYHDDSSCEGLRTLSWAAFIMQPEIIY